MGKIRKKYTEEQITQILKEAEVSNERFGYDAQRDIAWSRVRERA